MEPIPFVNDFYQFVWSVAILVWAIPETIGIFTQRVRGGATVRDRRSGLVVRISLIAGAFGGAFLAVAAPGGAIPWARLPMFWIGIALIPVGTALRWYAIRTLGRYFTRQVATHPDQTVVQSGPYRLIRHPSYTGTMLMLLGVGLTLGSWPGLILLLGLPLAGFSYRMHVEEQALIEGIGEPYREYMRHTWRLIPFVY